MRAMVDNSIKLVTHSKSKRYDELILEEIAHAQEYVLIATANVKNVMVKRRKEYESIINAFERVCDRGGMVRILHAAKPSKPFLKEIHKHPSLERKKFDMRECMRTHMKLISIDGRLAYMGSANLTGAGIGIRNEHKRNFEMGIITRDQKIINEAEDAFYDVWTGGMCRKCMLRDKCRLPIDKLRT